MRWVIYISIFALALILSAIFAFSQSKIGLTPLGKIHQKIAVDYPEMSHISPEAVEKQLSSDALLIFDTRPVEEYNISHIEGAVQIDPDISPDLFAGQFGDRLKNKKIVVYCSVGWRSTALGDRLQSAALKAGATSVKNMEGGLFGWHNDNRPLVNASGATSRVHPYNSFWGRLIENKSDKHYRP